MNERTPSYLPKMSLDRSGSTSACPTLSEAAASARGAVSPVQQRRLVTGLCPREALDSSSASMDLFMLHLPRHVQADHAGSAEAAPNPRGAVGSEGAPPTHGAVSPVVERPDAMIDEHRAEDEERAQSQAKAELSELLPRQRTLEVPRRPQVDAGREDLVRDEQDAASAQCYPKFSRTPSALRKLSNSSGNVLADAELDHCETFAIPSSDVKVGAYIGMGACCHVMRGAWRGRSVAIKTIKICDSAGADDAADNNS